MLGGIQTVASALQEVLLDEKTANNRVPTVPVLLRKLASKIRGDDSMLAWMKVKVGTFFNAFDKEALDQLTFGLDLVANVVEFASQYLTSKGGLAQLFNLWSEAANDVDANTHQMLQQLKDGVAGMEDGRGILQFAGQFAAVLLVSMVDAIAFDGEPVEDADAAKSAFAGGIQSTADHTEETTTDALTISSPKKLFECTFLAQYPSFPSFADDVLESWDSNNRARFDRADFDTIVQKVLSVASVHLDTCTHGVPSTLANAFEKTATNADVFIAAAKHVFRGLAAKIARISGQGPTCPTDALLLLTVHEYVQMYAGPGMLEDFVHLLELAAFALDGVDFVLADIFERHPMLTLWDVLGAVVEAPAKYGGALLVGIADDAGVVWGSKCTVDPRALLESLVDASNIRESPNRLRAANYQAVKAFAQDAIAQHGNTCSFGAYNFVTSLGADVVAPTYDKVFVGVASRLRRRDSSISAMLSDTMFGGEEVPALLPVLADTAGHLVLFADTYLAGFDELLLLFADLERVAENRADVPVLLMAQKVQLALSVLQQLYTGGEGWPKVKQRVADAMWYVLTNIPEQNTDGTGVSVGAAACTFDPSEFFGALEQDVTAESPDRLTESEFKRVIHTVLILAADHAQPCLGGLPAFIKNIAVAITTDVGAGINEGLNYRTVLRGLAAHSRRGENFVAYGVAHFSEDVLPFVRCFADQGPDRLWRCNDLTRYKLAPDVAFALDTVANVADFAHEYVFDIYQSSPHLVETMIQVARDRNNDGLARMLALLRVRNITAKEAWLASYRMPWHLARMQAAADDAPLPGEATAHPDGCMFFADPKIFAPAFDYVGEYLHSDTEPTAFPKAVFDEAVAKVFREFSDHGRGCGAAYVASTEDQLFGGLKFPEGVLSSYWDLEQGFFTWNAKGTNHLLLFDTVAEIVSYAREVMAIYHTQTDFLNALENPWTDGLLFRHCETLELTLAQVQSNPELVAKAYKTMVVQVHPDKKGGSAEKFIEVKNAYVKIRKPLHAEIPRICSRTLRDGFVPPPNKRDKATHQ